MTYFRKSGLLGAATGALILGLATAAVAQGASERPGPAGAHPGTSHHGSRQLTLLDTDGNGSANKAEISAELGRLLGAADVNGDSKLSADEFSRRGSFFLRLGTTTFFDLIDANGDQQITQEELNQPMERWFTRRDTNSDGNIDNEEFGKQRHGSKKRHR